MEQFHRDGYLVLHDLLPPGMMADMRADLDRALAENPPRLRLTAMNVKSLSLIVLPRRVTPAWSNDTSARDDAVAAIAATISEVE